MTDAGFAAAVLEGGVFTDRALAAAAPPAVAPPDGALPAPVPSVPFVVMPPDDIIHPPAGILAGMLLAHERTGSSVLCLKKVDHRETSLYGVADTVAGPDGLEKVRGLVEKPKPEAAPSDLGVDTGAVFLWARRDCGCGVWGGGQDCGYLHP